MNDAISFNALAGNFYMVILQYPAALILQTVAAIVRKLPDVRLGAGQGEDVLHPAVCLSPGQDAVFPYGIKHPVCFNPFVPQVPVGECALGTQGSGMDTHIGITFRVSGADIKVFVQRLLLIDVGCFPEYGAFPAVWAFDVCRVVFSFHGCSLPSGLCVWIKYPVSIL